jgi:hypothetical protein
MRSPDAGGAPGSSGLCRRGKATITETSTEKDHSAKIRNHLLWFDHFIVVVVIERCAVGRPVIVLGAVLRSTFQSALAYVGAIPAQFAVVSQQLLGHGIMLAADAEKAAEAQHGIGNFPAGLVDHDLLDRTYLLVVGAIDGFPDSLSLSVKLLLLALPSMDIGFSFAKEEKRNGRAMFPRRAAFSGRLLPFLIFSLQGFWFHSLRCDSSCLPGWHIDGVELEPPHHACGSTRRKIRDT